jgi:hypothetical protein
MTRYEEKNLLWWFATLRETMHKDMIPGVGLSRAKCSELQEPGGKDPLNLQDMGMCWEPLFWSAGLNKMATVFAFGPSRVY